VERYTRIAEKTKDWSLQALTLQAWIARVVVLDEYLSDGDAALAVLDEAVALYGNNPFFHQPARKFIGAVTIIRRRSKSSAGLPTW
jgi:hypothetical protein